MDDRMEAMEQRLSSLEGELQKTRQQVSLFRKRERWGITGMRTLSVVGLAVFTGICGMGAAPTARGPLTVKEPFMVVDHSGQLVMMVSTNSGVREMEMFDPKGNVLLKMSCDGASSSLMLKNGDGANRLHLGFDNARHPGLDLYHGNNALAGLRISHTGTGLLYIDDEKGVNVVDLRNSDHGGRLQLCGPGSSKERARFGANEEGGFGAYIYNSPAGQEVARLSESPTGSGAGYLGLGNPAGQLVVEGGMLPEGYGMMRAGPILRPGGALIPGSYIMGKLGE